MTFGKELSHGFGDQLFIDRLRVKVNALVHAPPCAGTIHGTGIEVSETVIFGQRLGCGRLADTRRSINCYANHRPTALDRGTHLGLRKHTVRSGFQIAKLNRTDLGAYQTLDRESDRTENATDDTVLAGMQHNLDQRAVAAGIKNRATVELDPAVVELYACSDQSAAHLTADATFQRGDVGLFDLVLWGA